MQVTNDQCPSCTGPLHFAGESGKLRLWSWGTAVGVSAILSLLLSGPLGRMIADRIG